MFLQKKECISIFQILIHSFKIMVKNLHSTFSTVKKHFPLRNVIKIMTNMNLLSEQFTTRWINFSMDEISIKSPKYNIIIILGYS